jgi:putative endonuclease
LLALAARNLHVNRGKTYYVYILASRSRNLYTGVTNSLKRRVREHKEGLVPGFTRKYRINRLVHFESFADVRDAIRREKQVKAWRRAKRVALISRHNPAWADLAEGWFDKKPRKSRSLAPNGRKGSG